GVPAGLLPKLTRRACDPARGNPWFPREPPPSRLTCGRRSLPSHRAEPGSGRSAKTHYGRRDRMSSIAELTEDRVVEGVYAVSRKRRLRTKSGSSYLALELVDPSGRIAARVWEDGELLDRRFGE